MLEWRPTRLYELVPLHTTLDGYHDASNHMRVGEVLPGPTAVPWTLQLQPSAANKTLDPTEAHPIFWCAQFPKDLSVSLVSWENPTNQVTNSDLELAVTMIHHT